MRSNQQEPRDASREAASQPGFVFLAVLTAALAVVSVAGRLGVIQAASTRLAPTVTAEARRSLCLRGSTARRASLRTLIFHRAPEQPSRPRATIVAETSRDSAPPVTTSGCSSEGSSFPDISFPEFNFINPPL